MLWWTLRKFRSADPNERRAAAAALGKSGDPEAGLALIAAFKEEKDEGLQSAVSEAMKVWGEVQSHRSSCSPREMYVISKMREAREWRLRLFLSGTAEAQKEESGASGGQRSEVPRGGFGEPYCSAQCYEQGGRKLGSARLTGAAGNCEYCKSLVGERCVILPKRNRLVFICGPCAGRVKADIQTLSRCYLCDAPLP